MGIVFAFRGNANYDARYSNGGKVGTAFNSSKISSTTGGISGNPITMTDATQVKYLGYSGDYNSPNGRAISVLMRMAPGYTGTPAASRNMWCINAGLGTTSAYLELRHDITTGNITGIGKNELGNNTLAVITFGSWSPTSGTYYDIVLTWDGTTTANAVKCYVDGTLLGQGTASNALSASWGEQWWKAIILGAGLNATTSSLTLDEFVIWDSVIDPTSVTLVSGSGSLNGASRTSLVAVDAFDGRTVASAVWDRLLSSHTTADTFGAFIQKLLTVTKFLGLK